MFGGPSHMDVGFSMAANQSGRKARVPEERRHHDRCQRCIRLRGQLRSLPGG
jgi:ribosomal protein S14